MNFTSPACKFEDLSPEVCSEDFFDDVLDKVRAHYKDLKAGQRTGAEIKVLSLGNGGTGKTQLCRHLRDFASTDASVLIVQSQCDSARDRVSHSACKNRRF
jgi:tetraacyldisaccharide-1-P 4'-kinase